jgi:excisionase family DNA binding protein
VPEPKAAPDSYSTAEVARRLGVSIPTVQRWVDQGLLKAWKTFGGHRRIDAGSVDAFVGTLADPRSQGRQANAPAVLVVEDSPIDRVLLATLVTTTWPDARLTLAENGFDALLAIGQNLPDIVLSDIVMPHMDGMQMLRQLTEPHRPQPRLLVAVSSLKPAQIRKMGGLPPRVLFIAKPIEPQLASAVLASAWQQAC